MSAVLIVNSTNFFAYVFILLHTSFQNDRGMDFSKRESMKEQLNAILEE